MLTYLLVIASVGWLSLKADKYRNAVQAPIDNSLAHRAERKQGLWYLWLAASILILVSGLRYGVGADYFAYSYSFYREDYEFWKRLITFHEPGYTLLMIISRWLYYDFTTMTLLTAFITVGFVFCIIQKYSEDYFFSALLFILLCHWQGAFNAMRQYLAMAVLFVGQKYIFEKKILQYMVVILIASCFHITALFMIPCYFLLNIKDQREYLLYLFVYGVIVYFCNNNFFEIMSDIKGVDQAEQGYAMRSVNILRTLVSFVPWLLFVFMPMKNIRNEVRKEFYLKMTMLNAILLCATYKSAYLARISIYTDIFTTLTFPALFKCYPNPIYKLLMKTTICCYVIFWFVDVTRRITLLPFIWVFER